MRRLLLATAALLGSLAQGVAALTTDDPPALKWLEVINHADFPVTALVLIGVQDGEQKSFNLTDQDQVRPRSGWTFVFTDAQIPNCEYQAAVMLSTGKIWWSNRPVDLCKGSHITVPND